MRHADSPAIGIRMVKLADTGNVIQNRITGSRGGIVRIRSTGCKHSASQHHDQDQGQQFLHCCVLLVVFH